MKYIDLSNIKKITDNDEALFNELINIFIEQIDEIKKIISKALENKNYELLKQASHKIKSSLRTFGAYNLASKFEDIETYDNLDSYNNLEITINELIYKLDLVSEEVKNLKSKNKNEYE